MAIKFNITDVAGSIPFDNDTNGFTSDNVQDAIEEAQNSAVGALIPLQFEHTGNTSNKWLGYTNPAAPSNEIPFVAPQNIAIKGITFVNRDDNVDIDIEIYKNGTLVHTENIRNKRWAYNVGISGPAGNQGDRWSIFLRKYDGGTGDQTAQDPIVVLYCKFTNEAAGSGGQQNGV